ncbi:ATP-binding protein [Planomonospora sp. ID82291]|uniref:ATP-binding protein n=1 Tax=Planomonospora sp. ID82291 TaxID=2738136 RepID=UPI0018C3E60E|nr:ATP-binding protein [Planomonospora sp. ID82291]MBG0817429.1 ATP-binding protein [Planomonospora sp. ID82291]
MHAARHDVPPELIDAMIGLFPGGLTWRRTFPGRPEQAAQARSFVGFLLADSPRRADAEQIVAELAANAVRHTDSGRPHGTFVVELGRTTAVITITVRDCGGGGVPAFGRRPDAAGESGRGLLLVAALADRAGCRGGRDTGHAVWAELGPE